MTGAKESVESEISIESAQKIWEDHPTNPFNWPEQKKWRIIFMAASVTLLVGLNATTPGKDITQTFNIDDSGFPNSFWPTTVRVTGTAIGPMVGLPLLEIFGVRNGYLVSTCCYFMKRMIAKMAKQSSSMLYSPS